MKREIMKVQKIANEIWDEVFPTVWIVIKCNKLDILIILEEGNSCFLQHLYGHQVAFIVVQVMI
jgi:hypothetical protein